MKALSAVSGVVVLAAAGVAGGEIVAAVAVAAAVVVAVGVLPGERYPVVGVGKLPGELAGWIGFHGEDGFPDRDSADTLHFEAVRVY